MATSYTVDGDDTAGYTGTWGADAVTANYLVSATADTCDGVPAFKFTMPTPPTRTGRVDKLITSSGVQWKANTVLSDLRSYSDAAGTTGGTFPANVQVAFTSYSTGAGQTATLEEASQTVFRAGSDGTQYHSITGGTQVGFTEQHRLWIWTPPDIVVGSSGYGATTITTVPAQPTAKSTRISIGAIFGTDPVTDKAALVNGQTVSWSGTLTVDPA